MLIQLKQNEQNIIASDGIMFVDGRLGLSKVIEEVKKRNKRFEKNFPHKIADAFEIGRITIKL